MFRCDKVGSMYVAVELVAEGLEMMVVVLAMRVAASLSSMAFLAWREPSFIHNQSKAGCKPSPVTALTGKISENKDNSKFRI